MARDEAYRKAEEAIERALRDRAVELDLNGLGQSDSEKLVEIPDSISQLTELRRLDIANNKLTSLPRSIGQLTQLRRLDLSKNQLKALPGSFGQFTQLRWLNLADNQLPFMPDSLGQFTQLWWLELSNMELTELPDSIGKLVELQVLDLDGNRLSALPTTIGLLKSLRRLNLAGNRLMQLPDSLGHLTQLEKLDLTSNQLKELPESLRRLGKLYGLYLHENPSLGLPNEVLGSFALDVRHGSHKGKPPAEILDYYFRIQGDFGRPIGECKLIVIGRGGVGKTSLIKRLSGQPYDRDERETHGISIQKLEFSGAKGQVTSRVWDFGGQVVLHSMHEFFLTARSLYLLVLGERDDILERDAAYWLQLVRSYAGDAPVVVALNKSAGRQRQFDRATLEQNYGPILGWVATECSESDEDKAGISSLRQTLTAALDSPHMDSVRRKFPGKWFAIKNALEAMPESFLDYGAYVKKCESHGERDPKEQSALAGDLHDLGVALNYARDPRLRDTSVLRPDWLANGIYAVLRANDLDATLPPDLNVPLAVDGVVTADSMARIHEKAQAWTMLRTAHYPAEKREFLLRLMDLFHLSYPLDDEGKKRLVPTLLPLHPPEGADEPQGSDCARLRYEFPVVPAPLLPWFIARTFSLIPGRLHWRRGTILVFGDARARVWTTPDERYVFVTAAGASEDRAELLTMIRGTLKELFQDYRGLRVTEQWEHKVQWVPRKTLEEFGILEPEEQIEQLPAEDEEMHGGEAQE